MTRRLRTDDGFTLVELLVAMGLMLMIVGATLTVFEGSQRTARKSQLQNEAQDQARTAIDRMARELRNQATPTRSLPTAVLKAEAQDIAFVAVGNTKPSGSLNSRNLSRVRYCLNTSTSTLWRQQRTWTTAAPPADVPDTSACPATSTWTTSQPIIDHVTNGASRAIWSFGPGGWTTFDQIRTVDTTLYVDSEPNNAPAESKLSTTVFLRNQNRPPVAVMQARAVGNGHVLLIGSSSSDPEGQTLTYVWKDGGTVITSCTNATCDYKPATTGVRSFTLEVSDPSDLPSTAGPVSVTVQ